MNFWCFINVVTSSHLIQFTLFLTDSYSCDVCSGLLTRKFINLLKQTQDGILDLNDAAKILDVWVNPPPLSHFNSHFFSLVLLQVYIWFPTKTGSETAHI